MSVPEKPANKKTDLKSFEIPHFELMKIQFNKKLNLASIYNKESIDMLNETIKEGFKQVH